MINKRKDKGSRPGPVRRCDLPASSCGKAAEQRQRAEEVTAHAALLSRGAIVARFPGRCADCSEPFPAGTLVQYQDRGQHLVAACCL